MDRYLVINSDGHAGLPPERYRDYLDPQYRDEFDRQLEVRLAALAQASELLEMSQQSADWAKDKHKDWQAERMAVYAAQIANVDRGVGRMLEVLKKAGQIDRIPKTHK